jgi:hypothetical protein
MTTRMARMARMTRMTSAIMARVRVGTEMEMELEMKMEMDEAENRPTAAPTREGALSSYPARRRRIDHVS